MKTWFLSFLIRRLIGLLLRNVKVNDLLGLVNEADRHFDRPFSKRGHVYRQVKAREKRELPQSVLNLVVELGVHLAKRVTKS